MSGPLDAAGEPVVAFDRVTKRFGDRLALDRLGFSVPRGRICGLLGPNGAGKTTLFRLLMGILKPTEGTIRVGGLDAFADRVATKRLIGFLPDEPIFHSYLSGRETLALSASLHGLDPDAALARVAPLITTLRLRPELDGYAEDYSRGTKKKLGLVMALLHRPSVLVLDEPTNGLDVGAVRLFCDTIEALAAAGTTVLFSSHLMDHVARLCSHAVVISAGRVVAEGPIGDLGPAHGASDLEDLLLRLTAGPATAR